MADNSQDASHNEIASYGFGRQMGDELVKHPLNSEAPGVIIEAVVEGLTDAFSRTPSKFNQEQFNEAFQTLQEMLQAKEAEKHKEVIEAGKLYLENNAKKEGVTVTASGLQYEVMTEGTGEIPTATSTVRTHYHGCLPSGEVFDSSVQRGQPAEFAVNGVIAGWTEALQLMPVGSKWRLVIPSELAYGERGAGGAIPPHATLVFEVELLAIV